MACVERQHAWPAQTDMPSESLQHYAATPDAPPSSGGRAELIWSICFESASPGHAAENLNAFWHATGNPHLATSPAPIEDVCFRSTSRSLNSDVPVIPDTFAKDASQAAVTPEKVGKEIFEAVESLCVYSGGQDGNKALAGKTPPSVGSNVDLRDNVFHVGDDDRWRELTLYGFLCACVGALMSAVTTALALIFMERLIRDSKNNLRIFRMAYPLCFGQLAYNSMFFVINVCGGEDLTKTHWCIAACATVLSPALVNSLPVNIGYLIATPLACPVWLLTPFTYLFFKKKLHVKQAGLFFCQFQATTCGVLLACGLMAVYPTLAEKIPSMAGVLITTVVALQDNLLLSVFQFMATKFPTIPQVKHITSVYAMMIYGIGDMSKFSIIIVGTFKDKHDTAWISALLSGLLFGVLQRSLIGVWICVKLGGKRFVPKPVHLIVRNAAVFLSYPKYLSLIGFGVAKTVAGHKHAFFNDRVVVVMIASFAANLIEDAMVHIIQRFNLTPDLVPMIRAMVAEWPAHQCVLNSDGKLDLDFYPVAGAFHISSFITLAVWWMQTSSLMVFAGTSFLTGEQEIPSASWDTGEFIWRYP